MKREHPDRFRFCAALPLPDVDAAIGEARYALDVLGADGIKLATNVQGQYLGAPELDTLFSFLNERKAVVILHPHRPEPVNRQVMQQTPLAMQEYLSETAHFKKYKQGTLHMVKSLKLQDLSALSPETMNRIFARP